MPKARPARSPFLGNGDRTAGFCTRQSRTRDCGLATCTGKSAKSSRLGTFCKRGLGFRQMGVSQGTLLSKHSLKSLFLQHGQTNDRSPTIGTAISRLLTGGVPLAGTKATPDTNQKSIPPGSRENGWSQIVARGVSRTAQHAALPQRFQ